MLVLEEKLYTSEETAEILGINPRTLYRYLKKGDIECETKTKSGTFRFSREQIYKYLYPDKYQKILTLLKQKEDTKYPYINNTVLDQVKPGFSSVSNNEQKPPLEKSSMSIPNVKENQSSDQNQNLLKDADKVVSDLQTPANNFNNDTSPAVSSKIKPNTVWQKPLKTADDKINSSTENLHRLVNKTISQDPMGDKPLNDISKRLDTVPPLAPQKTEDINIPDPHPQNTSSSIQPPSLGTLNKLNPQGSKNTLPDQDLSAIREERKNKKLTDELENLESTIDNSDPAPIDSTNQNSAVATQRKESEQNWKYFVNTNKDILQIAKEVNSLNGETGRQYAATMKGGLSLHHNIDEFNIVHFYIEEDDLNWWISHLELSICKKDEANICLIPTSDMSLFESAYKLRGLYVVSDDRLIQDLMKHGEKELAKTLL